MKKISEKGFVPFGQAIRDFFAGYFEFGGVSTRSGYWFAQLGIGIVYCVLFFWLLREIISQEVVSNLSLPLVLLIVFSLIIIIPRFALSIRRVRDTGIKSKAIFTIYIIYFALSATSFLSTYSKGINYLTEVIGNLGSTSQGTLNVIGAPTFLLFCTCLMNVFLIAITLLPTDFFSTKSGNGFLKAVFKHKKR